MQPSGFPAEGAQLYLQVIHSKDNRYAAFQLLTYTSFLYEPVTELCCLKGEKRLHSSILYTLLMDFIIDTFCI